MNAQRRGSSSSNTFACEHLATFVIGNGVRMTVEEGIKRLHNIEESGGVWTMKVHITVAPSCLIVTEDATSVEIERFPLNLLKDVQSARLSGAYSNLIVFSVLDNHIPELHIFRCIGRNANEFVTTVKSVKDGSFSGSGIEPIKRHVPPSLGEVSHVSDIQSASMTGGPKLLRKSLRLPSIPTPLDSSQITDSTDRNVKLLDCLFSDVEAFVNQLQKVVEAFNNLRKRRTVRQNGNGDGLVTMRCRLPPGKDFTDILQKLKLSFILIEKLKHKIHNPNAPELIHFLFRPLLFMVKVIAGPNLEKMDLVSSVDNPLINDQVKLMFENCLDSAENDLWRKLGPSWTSTREEWHERLPIYRPVFQDGWSPPLDWMREIFPEDNSAQEFTTQRKNRTQEDFMKELQMKSSKIALAKESRQAANAKELDVNAGDVLEVLDDSKNWWKVKNYKDEQGFAPKRILQMV